MGSMVEREIMARKRKQKNWNPLEYDNDYGQPRFTSKVNTTWRGMFKGKNKNRKRRKR